MPDPVSLVALFVSLIALSFQLVDKKVLQSIGDERGDDYSDARRHLARSLLHLVFLGTVITSSGIFTLPLLSEGSDSLGMFGMIWICGCFLLVAQFAIVLWRILRMAHALRDPDTIGWTELGRLCLAIFATKARD